MQRVALCMSRQWDPNSLLMNYVGLIFKKYSLNDDYTIINNSTSKRTHKCAPPKKKKIYIYNALYTLDWILMDVNSDHDRSLAFLQNTKIFFNFRNWKRSAHSRKDLRRTFDSWKLESHKVRKSCSHGWSGTNQNTMTQQLLSVDVQIPIYKSSDDLFRVAWKFE